MEVSEFSYQKWAMNTGTKLHIQNKNHCNLFYESQVSIPQERKPALNEELEFADTSVHVIDTWYLKHKHHFYVSLSVKITWGQIAIQVWFTHIFVLHVWRNNKADVCHIILIKPAVPPESVGISSRQWILYCKIVLSKGRVKDSVLLLTP